MTSSRMDALDKKVYLPIPTILLDCIPKEWLSFDIRVEPSEDDIHFLSLDHEDNPYRSQAHINSYKIALIPDQVLEHFILSKGEVDECKLNHLTLLKRQRDEVFLQACKNKEFRHFLFTECARATLMTFQSQLLQCLDARQQPLFADVSLVNERAELHNALIGYLMGVGRIKEASERSEAIFLIPYEPKRFLEYEYQVFYHIVTAQKPSMYVFRQLCFLYPCYFEKHHAEFNRFFAKVVERDLRDFLNLFAEQDALYQLLSEGQRIVFIKDPTLSVKLNSEKKAMLLFNIYTNSDVDCVEKRKMVVQLAKELINGAPNRIALHSQMKVLEQLEHKNPFLTLALNRGFCFINCYRWKGKAVSREWIELMKLGKERMLHLASQQPVQVGEYSHVYQFLNVPTRAWTHFFNIETKQAKQLKETHINQPLLVSRSRL